MCPTLLKLGKKLLPKMSQEKGAAAAAAVAATAAAASAAAVSTINQEPLTVEPQGPIVPPEQIFLFMDIYECAKNNVNWQKVAAVLSDNPKWLTQIPQGRRWTILHQVVFCGDVNHLNEALSFQITNREFRLLCKTLDDKTVREVATERAHLHPQMLRRIERLVAIDQILNNARENKWDLVKQFLRVQPDIVNEKPPYRRKYLAHYLASVGRLDIFQELSAICHFKLNLTVENKKINELAREHNHIQFAEYIEGLLATVTEDPDQNEIGATASAEPNSPTASTHPPPHTYSHGFYDDPGIMILSITPNSGGSTYYTHDNPFGPHGHNGSWSLNSHHNPTTVVYEHNPVASAMSTAHSAAHSTHEHNSNENKKSKPHKTVTMTKAEQTEYENRIMDNIKKLPVDGLLNSITCCITKSILVDPVVAADGFTYEREAILTWFQQSNRSPMTNQQLENFDVKPNHAIHAILQIFSEPKSVAVKK